MESRGARIIRGVIRHCKKRGGGYGITFYAKSINRPRQREKRKGMRGDFLKTETSKKKEGCNNGEDSREKVEGPTGQVGTIRSKYEAENGTKRAGGKGE